MHTPSLFDATIGRLNYALDGLAQRQELISTNIANIDTPGYLTHETNFEQQLLNSLSAHNADGSPIPDYVPGSLPEAYTRNDLRIRNDGNNVDINQQMIEMSYTNLTYQAGTQFMSHKFSMLKTALAPIS
jgi:flagellar basal-body rod protein FlgB